MTTNAALFVDSFITPLFSPYTPTVWQFSLTHFQLLTSFSFPSSPSLPFPPLNAICGWLIDWFLSWRKKKQSDGWSTWFVRPPPPPPPTRKSIPARSKSSWPPPPDRYCFVHLPFRCHLPFLQLSLQRSHHFIASCTHLTDPNPNPTLTPCLVFACCRPISKSSSVREIWPFARPTLVQPSQPWCKNKRCSSKIDTHNHQSHQELSVRMCVEDVMEHTILSKHLHPNHMLLSKCCAISCPSSHRTWASCVSLWFVRC